MQILIMEARQYYRYRIYNSKKELIHSETFDVSEPPQFITHKDKQFKLEIVYESSKDAVYREVRTLG